MLLKGQAMFYTYCPMNNVEACGGKDKFEAGQSTENFDVSLSAVGDDGNPLNDACTYDIEAPKETFKEGAKVVFELTAMKKLKVYLRVGDNANTAKSIKGRRRLQAVMTDTPLEVNTKYPVDLSQGKLNLVVIPDEGTKPGETELKFEYRVEGEKLPPPAPPVVEPTTTPVPITPKEEEGGIEVILIIVCAVLLILVLVCCVLYV